MTVAALLLLSILTTLLTFMLGTLVLEAFWAIRSEATARGSPCGAFPQPVPVTGALAPGATLRRAGEDPLAQAPHPIRP